MLLKYYILHKPNTNMPLLRVVKIGLSKTFCLLKYIRIGQIGGGQGDHKSLKERNGWRCIKNKKKGP